MPTYEYECTQCGRVLQVTQRMTEDALTNCNQTAVAECEENGELRKLLSAGNGLIFKGSGFYITDYKNGNGSAKESGNGSGTEKSGAEAKSESKSESKPAADSGSCCGGGACGTD